MSATYRSKYEAFASALPKREQRLLACRIARWALTEHRVEDPRAWEAVAVAERYAEGLATQAELFAAWDAAWAAQDAAEDAAQAAAWSARAAAWDADWDADWSVAQSAARSAALAAALDAGGAAAVDTVYKMFFEWALELAIGEKVMA